MQIAHNGQAACHRLRAEPYDFDVVLMDVQMPVLDGYGATQHIRAELGLVDLPIIALTAGALSSERQRAFAAGMDDFIIKPFDAPTLITSILRHVRLSVLQAATPTDALTGPPAPETFPWPEIAGIDSTDARVRLCDDFGLFVSNLKRLLDEFADTSFPRTLEAGAALTAYAARMHKLTGTAGMLGANAIQQLAADARAACTAGEIKIVERLAEALGGELERLAAGAGPVLRASRERAEEALRSAAEAGTPLKPQQLADLVQSLRQQSLSALRHFESVAGRLRTLLGDATFEIVRDQVENLRFMDAVRILEEIGRMRRDGVAIEAQRA